MLRSRLTALTCNALVTLTALGFMSTVHAESVSPKNDLNLSTEEIVQTLLGSGVTVSNITFLGKNAQIGTFSNYQSLFGADFNNGVILSTGNVNGVVADENSNDKVTTVFKTDSVSDADLGNKLYDPAKLSLSFVPVFNTLTLDFIFGSEEYNEYVHSGFNDQLQILVNGDNCAKTPDGQIFSIDTVNDRANYPPLFGSSGESSNSDLYINNDPGLNRDNGEAESPSVALYATQMDGFTKLIQCRASVVPNQQNTLVIGIVDKGDAKYDSWAFFRARSLNSTHEVDTGTGLEQDSDNDGIPDSIEDPDNNGRDGDNDGIADKFDLDSDNDGLPDSIEFQGDKTVDTDQDGLIDLPSTVSSTLIPVDSDGDGIADYLDLDSDNDSLTDLAESLPNGTTLTALDADLDGVLNNSTDSDSDGLFDIVDPTVANGSAGQPLNIKDSDADGYYNYRDADADNDGIPDRIEAANGINIDTDGDGIANYLDLDSDNDGIPDSIEFQGNGNVDKNRDGRVDNSGRNISPDLLPIDSDVDGIPDYLDVDSDNDGITDLEESPFSSGNIDSIDADGNGEIDSIIDADGDGLLDIVDPEVEGGTAGTPLMINDLDGDGLLNYRDTDSDGDSFTDDIENDDFDKNGTIDRLEKGEGLKTAVSGVGSLGWQFALLLPLLLIFRRNHTSPKKQFSKLKVFF